MRELFKKYYHAIPVLVYLVVYLLWFKIIETYRVTRYTVVHMNIDDKIPFLEVFIIPYFIWFGYIALIVAYTFFKDKEGYYRVSAFLMTGMTVFLLISTLWPNIQHLRPAVMPRDNVFTHMVKFLYSIDTPTNLWPSIHVYNSLGVHFAVVHNERLGNNKRVRRVSFVIMVSIILSTVFLKQHSMFDVMTAFIMAGFVYLLVYRLDLIMSVRRSNIQRKARKRDTVI